MLLSQVRGYRLFKKYMKLLKRDQFLMKLRKDFESVRSNLMSRHPSPSLDIGFSELLREEQRCQTQAAIEQKVGGSNPLHVAYATQVKGRDMSKIQCYSCKEFGHIANQCKNKFCNYCKKAGHLIADCRRRPQNRTSQAFHATTMQPPQAFPASNTLTPEVVQQMIQSAFSALGITGKTTSPSVWYIDSGASNHMTSSSVHLTNVKPYVGNSQIQTANGECLGITSVGDIPHTLPLNNVFHTPLLTSNLISVGQLVDNNCKVSFSKSGCIVQDQDSGKVIHMTNIDDWLYNRSDC
uniref:CCHC-type domain-containing protein n=1 Tax=Davidia involucrata TaxID=16924 RepID=A0A5B7C134_DAVIN